MYERFTDRARKVAQLADQEARQFNHEYIGTEHILLGLIKEGSGVAANVLKNLDVDLRKVRLEVEKLVQSGPDMVTMGKLPQTPRAKKVIEYSMEEARNLGHGYVGTEHILLGLLREQEGVAAQVLVNLGLRLEEVRDEVLNLLGHGMESGEGERIPWMTVIENSKRRTRFPLVQHYLLALDNSQQLARSSNSHAERASARNAVEVTRQLLERLYTQLEADPGFASTPLVEPSTRIPLPWPDVRPARTNDISHVASLLSHSSVILVGDAGSGRFTLACFVARELSSQGMQRGERPRQLLLPNHLALLSAPNGYQTCLETLLVELLNDGSQLLAIPSLHDLCSHHADHFPFDDSWKTALSRLLTERRHFLAWTTSSGLAALRKKWPGIVNRATTFPLTSLSPEALRSVLSEHLAVWTGSYGAHFEPDFADAILQNAPRYERNELVDPGRTLVFARSVLDFVHLRLRGETDAQRELRTQYLHSRQRAFLALSADDPQEIDAVLPLLPALRDQLGNHLHSIPDTRSVSRADIDAFLRRTHGRAP